MVGKGFGSLFFTDTSHHNRTQASGFGSIKMSKGNGNIITLVEMHSYAKICRDTCFYLFSKATSGTRVREEC